MNYLHYDFYLKKGESVEVTLNKRANVRLLDNSNYSKYKRGMQHKYYGGLATKSPTHLTPPHPGHWHVVIDLGGYAGTVKASARTIREV
jgi:Domain of unknown function (DUF1883)